LADVGVDELGLRTERAQLLSERFAGLITPTGNDHLRALLGEGNGGGTPDTGESAGDQDNLIAHLVAPLARSIRAVGREFRFPSRLRERLCRVRGIPDRHGRLPWSCATCVTSLLLPRRAASRSPRHAGCTRHSLPSVDSCV